MDETYFKRQSKFENKYSVKVNKKNRRQQDTKTTRRLNAVIDFDFSRPLIDLIESRAGARIVAG